MIVRKFGGSVLQDVDSIVSVFSNFIDILSVDKENIIVVSAFAGHTNNIIKQFLQLSNNIDSIYADFAISSAEQIVAGFVAAYLDKCGIKAKPFAGWQIPILTTDTHGCVHINNVLHKKIINTISEGVIPIVCGFQGVDSNNNITTLGRGGSDITAISIAASVCAQECVFYKNSSVLFSVGNILYGKTQKIQEIDYDSVINYSYNDYQFIQYEALLYAKENNVKIRIEDMYDNNNFTIIKHTDAHGFLISVKEHIASININDYSKLCNIDADVIFSDRNCFAHKKDLSITNIDYGLEEYSSVKVFAQYNDLCILTDDIKNISDVLYIDQNDYSMSIIVNNSGVKKVIECVHNKFQNTFNINR